MQTPPACGALLGKRVPTRSLVCHFFLRKGIVDGGPCLDVPGMPHALIHAVHVTLLPQAQLLQEPSWRNSSCLLWATRRGPALGPPGPLPWSMTGVSSGSGRPEGTAFKSSTKSLDLSDPLFPCLQKDRVRLKEPPFHVLPHSVVLKHLGFGTAHELTQKLS